MLLVFDVGNTNMVLGLYKGKELIKYWRITTDKYKTSDEYGILISNLFQYENIDMNCVEDVIISSVVPDVMHSLENFCKKYCKKEPKVVGPGIKTGLNIKYDNPKQVGADRIVNAITNNAEYLGGTIAPGIKISSEALFQRASKLPRVELVKPGTVTCKNTVSAMQAGIIYGYAGMVERLIDMMKKELNQENVKVIATGGLSTLIASETKSIDHVDRFLTLDGLRILHEKNKE